MTVNGIRWRSAPERAGRNRTTAGGIRDWRIAHGHFVSHGVTLGPLPAVPPATSPEVLLGRGFMSVDTLLAEIEKLLVSTAESRPGNGVRALLAAVAAAACTMSALVLAG
jgi:hypothetical protein